MTLRRACGSRRGPGADIPPRVIVDRFNQEILVTPPCEEALAPLRTARHALVDNGQGHGRVVAVPEPFAQFDDHPCGPRRYYPAGLEPVIVQLLQRGGYEVLRTGDAAATLPPPGPNDGRGMATVDAAFLAFMHGHERGLVRYDARAVDPAWLVAQARLAFPGARIAVAAGTREVAWAFGRCLKAIVPSTTVAPGDCHGPAGPLVVTTFFGLGADGVDLHRRDILFVANAPEALGQWARRALPGAPRARLYGLIDRSRRLAPFDRDRVAALFGLDEVVVPRHGCVERPVQVVTLRVTGGPLAARPGDVVGLKRLAIWGNPIRNRRIARLAVALASGDRGRLAADFPAVAGRLAGDSAPRVLVLAEGAEHAAALAGRLPGWPLVLGPDLRTDGLPKHRAELLASRRWPGDAPPVSAIATFAGLEAAPALGADVVVRADGGPHVPEALEAIRITRNHGDRSLVLVDLDDRHPALRPWGRRRRGGYLAAGWSVGGGTGDSDVDRFLATRPGGTR